VRELVAALGAAFPDDRLELYAHRFRGNGAAATPPALPPNARLHARRIPWRVQEVLGRLGFGADRMLGGADVLHATDYVTLPASRVPLVATIHDLLFEDLPECYTPAMRRGLRWTTRRLLRSARRVLVPSERTREALLRTHGGDPGRVDVVPHGARPLPGAAPAREHGAYVLFVGTLEPRKNVPRLLEAHDLAVARVGAFRLVVAGARGWDDEGTMAAMARRPLVAYEGPVGPERLSALYGGALAVAYPSLGEGFGLPVLEAMAAGKPVLVGADTACSDLAGDAGVAADPTDVEALADALAFLVADEALRARLGARGRERAQAYTWERAARATRACYERAIGS
jgi:glycosyltransferase involved in cell wall biosynthesis